MDDFRECTRLCEGRVCIVTGAGRGLGREYALSLAAHGAKVVVNDLGGETRRYGSRRRAGRTGRRRDPAPAVVKRRPTPTTSAPGTARPASSSRRSTTFGGLDVLVNNAGILRDRMLFSMSEDDWDAVIRVHLKGTFAPSHHAGGLLASAVEGRRDQRRPPDQHDVGVGALRQRRPDQLRRGQGGHRLLHADRRPGARPLRRHRQRHRPWRAHPAHRRPSTVPTSSASSFAPTWVAPVVTWLASADSADVTGQVIEASGLVLAVAEGWHRGPSTEPAASPKEAGDAYGACWPRPGRARCSTRSAETWPMATPRTPP